MNLKKGVEPGFSSDPWYDILDGGYFDPEDFLDNPQDIDEVRAAIELLLEYKDLVIVEM